jgi:hypothetical protein
MVHARLAFNLQRQLRSLERKQRQLKKQQAAPVKQQESKSASKKAKKNAEWEVRNRKKMKAKGKEKRHAKLDRKKAARRDILWSMNKEERAAYLQKEKEEQEARDQGLLSAKTNGVAIVVDYSLDEHNKPHESTSLIRQTVVSYSVIKGMVNPFHLTLCSVLPGTRTALALGKVNASKWKAVDVTEKRLSDLEFPSTQQLCFLSPDAEEILDAISKEWVYVIGGMVDNTRIMGKTQSIAKERGIRCARLPIPELFGNDVDPVLNVNTVVHALAAFQTSGCWTKALEEALPPRKLSRAK